MPTPVGTPLAEDATGSNVASFNFTVPNEQSNRALVVSVSYFDTAATTIASATYGGQPLTTIRTDGTPGSSNVVVLLILLDPPTGENTLQITMTQSVFGFFVAASAWAHVDQSDAVGDSDGGVFNGQESVSIPLDTTAHDVVIGHVHVFEAGAAYQITQGGTLIAEQESPNPDEIDSFNAQYVNAAGSSTSTQWTFSRALDFVTASAFVLKGVGSPGQSIAGSGDVTLDDATLDASSEIEIAGSLEQTLDNLAAEGSGSVAIEGSGDAQLGETESASQGSVDITGTADVTLDDLESVSTPAEIPAISQIAFGPLQYRSIAFRLRARSITFELRGHS